MIVDIHLRFNGFHGTDGRCHIRFCKASHAVPLVIVCSQYKNYIGTSVTNAIEIIAKKVFYLVANNEIDDVRFDFELPLYDEWHDDVNTFDKILTHMFPEKYRPRFISRKLRIADVFSHIVWIEHYPEDWNGSNEEKRCFRATLDDNGHPQWFAVSDAWLTLNTGMSSDDLFIDGSQLVLHQGDGRRRQAFQSSEITLTRSGLQIIRWTEELVAGLPTLLNGRRARIGLAPDSDIPEDTIRDLITDMFASRLPSVNLFKSNFNFSAALGIKKQGRQKNLDFAIFDPAGQNIDAILELKRTSSSSNTLRVGVVKDIARLLLLSKNFRCPCYLLICGDIEIIRAKLNAIDQMLSFDEHPSFMDAHFYVNCKDFDSEYSELLEKFKITKGSTRLQGSKTDGHTSVFLWQISADMSSLTTNRPYRYEIQAVI